MRKKRLLISINSSWNFVNFRAGLVRALVAHGYDVVAVAPTDPYVDRLAKLGARFVPLPMDSRGTSPVRDARLLAGYIAIMRRERPDAFIGYTIKPNIYGSLAARLFGIPTINNIAGLGSMFLSRGPLNQLVRGLYRTALQRAGVVFFQNPDDRRIFLEKRLVPGSIARLLPGSGVDTERFAPASKPPGGQFVFLLVARMLWAKGVADFVEAARKVKATVPSARFKILGIVDEKSKGAIDRATIDGWVKAGVIEFPGAADDVRLHMAAADCVVLPTYYPEGTPRTLLEAAAMAKPLIATDVAGCRQIVDHGVNGFLVPPRDPERLAQAMLDVIAMPADRLDRIGLASREKAEREFDERIVVAHYLQALSDVGCAP